MDESTKKPDLTMPFDFSQFSQLGMGTGAWASMAEASRKMLDTAATMNKEILEFVSARMKEDMATQQKLLQSRSFEEMQATYTTFFQKASQQYVEEMQKLMTMASGSIDEAAQSGAKPPRK
ncbi:MAG: phasin family protein [Alphaproteobacteria bacterium]